MASRRPRPLRVWFYRGGWRWACRVNAVRAGYPVPGWGRRSEYLPCAGGRRPYATPAAAYADACSHLRSTHTKEEGEERL